MSRRLLQFLAILTVFSPLMGCGGPDPNVTMQHNDPSRTGAYLAETSLTPANVLSRGMREKYSIGSCDGSRPAPRNRCLSGTIVTQPLYVRNVDFNPVKRVWPFWPSATHTNGLFLATQNNMVYALDANTGEGRGPGQVARLSAWR